MKDLDEFQSFAHKISQIRKNLAGCQEELEYLRNSENPLTYGWELIGISLRTPWYIDKNILIEMYEKSVKHLTDELRKIEEAIQKFEAPK